MPLLPYTVRMRFLTKLSLLLVALAVAAVSFAGSLAGTYSGRLVIDRGQLPRTTKGGEMSHAAVQAYSKIKLTLTMKDDGTFLLVAKTGPTSVLNTGTYTRSGDTATLIVTKKNGQAVSNAVPMPMKISKNEHELQLGFGEGEMAWFSFNKN